MDLLTKAANNAVHNRLASLADELGETPYDLALAEIRRYQTCVAEHRLALAEILHARGID